MKSTVLVTQLLLAALASGPKIVNIKHDSPDYKAIVQAVTPYANAHSSQPCRIAGDTMKRSADWAFVFSSLQPVDAKIKSTSSLMALLRKGRRWTIREIVVSSAGFDDAAVQWSKKYDLPAALLKH